MLIGNIVRQIRQTTMSYRAFFLKPYRYGYLALVMIFSFHTGSAASISYPFNGHAIVEIGDAFTYQGESQHINIPGLIGSQYTLNNSSSSNLLVGLGYLLKGMDRSQFQLDYGINAFYFVKTSVSGEMILENRYTNLSYNYQIQHIPVYFTTKGLMKFENKRYNITLDAGIGPNFLQMTHYNETPLTTYTIPPNNFSSHRNVVFTAMAGAGLRFNNFFRTVPLECGYRYFYLGNDHLQINNNQIQNMLSTGNMYAHTVICSIII